MKKWILLLLAGLLLLPVAAFSQNRSPRQPSRQDIIRYNAERMAGSLALEGKTRTAFVSLYGEFYSEMLAIRSQLKKQQSADMDSEREVEERILSDFATSRKILDLRESYYQKFRALIPASKILEMYQIEKQHAEKRHDSE